MTVPALTLLAFLAPAALGLLLRSSVVLALGFAAVRLARRRGPQTQAMIGRAALAAAFLLVVLAPLPLPSPWHVALPAARPAPPRLSARPFPVYAYLPTKPAVTKAAQPLPDPSSSASYPARQNWGGVAFLLGLWGAGTAALLLWLGACQLSLVQLTRRAAPVTDGPAFEGLAALSPRPPRLFVHLALPGPFLAGIVRPALFLPADHAEAFSPPALRAVFLHELAHRERRDTAWTLAARVLCALLWPQPLAWLLCRRLEALSEDVCDQAVLAGCPARVYADCLLSLAERRPLARRTRAVAVGVVPVRSDLGRRVQMILRKGTQPMPAAVTPRQRVALGIATVTTALGGTLLLSAAPAQVAPPALVGIWSGKFSPTVKQTDTLVFGPQGELASVEQGGSQFKYGRYELNGAALTVRMAGPIFDARHRKIGNTQTAALAFTYSIADGVLTLQRKGAPTVAARRISDYPDGLPVEAVAAQQAAQTGTAPGQADEASFHATSTETLPFQTSQPRLRTFTIRFRVPSSGSHRVRVFVSDDAGQRLVFNKICPPGTGANVPINAAGKTISFRVYDNEKLVKTEQSVYDTLAKNAVPPSAPALPPPAPLGEAQLLAGSTPVEGSGLVVTLQDGRKFSAPLPPGMAPPNIIHDSDIATVVNEMKAYGAEAIAVNDQRLVATSAVRCTGRTVLVNGIPQAPPFVIKAIGDPKTLRAGVEMPGGVAAQIRVYDPAMVTTREAAMLILPAYHPAGLPRYAHIAP